jgi:hypothetical protein
LKVRQGMGYQLWTSPITGYRRKGTRLNELRSLFATGITSRAFLEPLRSCPADAPAGEMANILRARDFDVAGVQSSEEGPVIGFVHRNALQQGYVRDYLQLMTAEHLISDGTPLASLLSILKARESVFVLVGLHVRGIVTRADLNKPLVRVYLFGLISLLEMHLGFWVRDAYPDETWKSKLARKRLEKAEKLQRDRRSRNQQMNLLDCLQFCDKRDLVLARMDILGDLGLGSRLEGKSLLERTENLRNLLAHRHLDLTEGSSWIEVIEVVEKVEAVVDNYDDLVEGKAMQSAIAGLDALWGSA